MHIRPITATDFYKIGHYQMYSPGTTKIYSNFTPRDDKHALSAMGEDFDHKVVFFGLQGICQWLLIDLWNKEFFDQPKNKVINHYANRIKTSLGVDTVDTSHIESLHDLGYLPIVIKALPEGSRVNVKIPLFTITNTLPQFFWLTNYLETQISSEIWKSVTSATTAYEFRKLFIKYAEKTGAPEDFVPFQGHDFSMRGMSNIYDAAISGAAHLTSFYGTDTIPGIDYLEDYYGGSNSFIGGSVVATEHSVMCGNIISSVVKDVIHHHEAETNLVRKLITELFPTGIVSIVSDSFDYWHAITDGAIANRDIIMNRDGKVVFRPDSGDPVKIIVGDQEANPGSPEYKGSVECLWDIFGGIVSDKGYKVLDSHVGLIYGDSINLKRARQILEGLEAKGFASSNIVFGIGSYTYNHVTRDTYGCAIKATYTEINGVPYNIYKDPKTDNGVKKSAKGLLRVEKEGNNFVLYDQQTPQQEMQGELKEVFRDGKMMRFQSIDEIRKNLWFSNDPQIEVEIHNQLIDMV